ncbi:MAG: ATP-binding protein [Pseudomonadota bacterium]|nr:ATP-binding protein [Pseudomonadota bacterium]
MSSDPALAAALPQGEDRSSEAAQIAQELSAIGRLEVVPKLLQILCKVTGMRFAAIARVTDRTWTACAVEDGINFGLLPGSQLDVNTTLCIESRASGAPIVFDRASMDEHYCKHEAPKLYNIESYVSVPIVMPGGRYFGSLFALDPKPASVSDPKTLAIFNGVSELIALLIDGALTREKEQSALRDAHAASELREQFMAILGHDLRNPLQAIQATGELLERRLTDFGLKSLAARIKSNARRMSSLIDDVLDFARGRLGGGIGLRLVKCENAAGALVSVVQELKDARPDRSIILDVTATKPVCCDIARVQQVLSNLVGNAIAHGSADTPIKVAITDTGNDLELRVWNDGDPIPRESIDKIFEPFWRRSTPGDRPGLGLGLHICSQIVRAHHGHLSVTSTTENGTLFTARLPLNPRAAD